MAKQKIKKQPKKEVENGEEKESEKTEQTISTLEKPKADTNGEALSTEKIASAMANSGLDVPRKEPEYNNMHAGPSDDVATPTPPELPPDDSSVFATSDEVKKMAYANPAPPTPAEDASDNIDSGNALSDEYSDEEGFDTGDDAPTAAQQIGARTGRSTSEFVWRNVENGIPAIGSFLTSANDNVIYDALIPHQMKMDLLSQVMEYNAESKQKFVVPQWHKDNIEPALKEWFTERGWETVIPAWAEVAVGGVFLLGWFYMTYREVGKHRQIYEAKLQATVEQAQNEYAELLRKVEQGKKGETITPEKTPEDETES